MLPEKAIKEFKEIYRKHYGVELSNEEASLRANNLIALYRAVYSEPVCEQAQPGKEKKDGKQFEYKPK